MRRRFTGHVGDASWGEAWSFLESGGKGVLIVLRAESGGAPRITEKALHFSEGEALRLPFRPGDPCAAPAAAEVLERASPGGPAQGGSADKAAEDAAREAAAKQLLEAEIAELESWRGEPFECLEGPLPPGAEERSGALRIPLAPASLGAIRKDIAAPPPGGGAPLPSRDPRESVEALTAAAGSPLSGHMALLQLASAWKSIGSPHRASESLRGAAAKMEEWGLEAAAVQCLEEALSICPADVRAAERLLSLHQRAGKRKEAEEVAEGTGALMDGWSQHDLLIRLCKLLEKAPRSEELRRAEAEAMVRTGDVAHGVKELASVAAALESRGEREAARRIHERILEIDPTNSASAFKLRGIRRLEAARVELRRWGYLAAAILLASSWVLWDQGSASALESRSVAASPDTRREMEELRAEAARFPLSRHAARLAQREEDLYRKAFAEELGLLEDALEAQRAGDTGTAYHLFGKIAKGGVLPPFIQRAEVGKLEISRLDSRRQALLQHAMKLVQGGDNDAAFKTFVEILRGADRSLTASSYVVPLHFETIPPGAVIVMDGTPAGKTPRWVAVSSDPAAKLKLALDGFAPVEIQDPVGRALTAGTCRSSRALDPDIAWEARSGGGILAAGERFPEDPVVVLGGDGVLRALDARSGRTLWEAPLDGRAVPAGAPVIAGTCAVLGTTQGRVMGVAIASGKHVWSAAIAATGDVRLGPIVEGQIAVTSGRNAALVSPLVGLVSKRFAGAGAVDAVGLAAWEDGDEAALVLADGKVQRMALRTGAPLAARQLSSEAIVSIARAGDTWIALGKEGALVAYAREKLWEGRMPKSYTLIRGAEPSRVILGSADGSLMGLDASSGSPSWKTSLDGRLLGLSEPEGRDDVIVASVDRETKGTRAVAIRARDGTVLWEIPIARGESASARVSGKTLLVSSPGIGVKAFRLGTW